MKTKIDPQSAHSSASLILSGVENFDRSLIILCGNIVRDEFEFLLRKKYQSFHNERLKKIRENAGKSIPHNWQVHGETIKSWEELQDLMPNRMVERFQDKFPSLHITEIWICCLRYFNFEFFEIAELLCCSKKSVHTKASRIRQKLKITGKRSIARFFEETPWIV